MYCNALCYRSYHIMLHYIRESGVRTNVFLTTCVTCGERKNMEEDDELGRERRKKTCLSSFFSSTLTPLLFSFSSPCLFLFYFSSSPPIILFRHLDINTPMRVEKGFLKYLCFRLQLVIRRYPRQHSQLHADLR